MSGAPEDARADDARADDARPDRTRTAAWADPALVLRAAPAVTGLELLRMIVRGELPRPPIAALLDFDLVEADRGRVVFEATPAEYHYNPGGVVHGGFVATLLDSAMGCAVQSILPSGGGYSTVDLHTHFVRTLTAATGRVRCEGEVVHAGSRIVTAQGRLIDARGKLCAHGTETCLLLGDR